MSIVASLRSLSKIYRKPGTDVEVAALRNLDLDLVEGEYTAIMGASGSGKSTLMNILGCLDQPTSGHYILGDVDVSVLHDNVLSEIRSSRIGFVFQNFNLIQQLTVLENLEVPMFYLGVPPRERRRRAMELAVRVGLEERVQPPADAALRRPAAARVHRAGDDQRSADPAGRRTDRGA